MWLDDVASGKLSMSQRRVSSIESKCGMDVVCRLAKERGIHLMQLTDDKGHELVGASLHPFKVLT